MSPNETSRAELEPDTGSFPCKSGLSLPPLLSALLGPNDPLALSTVLSHPCLVEQRAGQVSRRRTVDLCGLAGSPRGEKNPFGHPESLWGKLLRGYYWHMDKRCNQQFLLCRWLWKVEMGAPGFNSGSNRVTENEMVRWHHWLSGHEFEQTRDSEGQGCLACCNPWHCKESETT